MRIMCATVLTMESILMGFALLIAKDQATSLQMWLGGALSILFLLTAGMLKRKGGYLLGSILQFLIIGYGYVISLMFYMGGLFAALWVVAIFLGRRGEAIKAALIASADKNGPKKP
jgi:hypothetical protein